MNDESSALSRWSRLKRQATADKQAMSKEPVVAELERPLHVEAEIALQLDTSGVTPDLPEIVGKDNTADDGAHTDDPTINDQALEEPLLTDADMPELSTLTPTSDISMFFNRGVSFAVRKAALKFVFQLAPYNVRDGLNDYDEDYTVFEPLGDTVTCDMKFHQERKEREAREAEEEEARLAEQQKESEAANDESVDDEVNDDASKAESSEAESDGSESDTDQPADSDEGLSGEIVEHDELHAEAGQSESISEHMNNKVDV